MKRLIKYFNKYSGDEAKFSRTSTDYEILPVLVEDSAGFMELLGYCRDHGISITDQSYELQLKDWQTTPRANEISHAIGLKETKELSNSFRNETEEVHYWLGWIQLSDCKALPAVETPGQDFPKNLAEDIFNRHTYEFDIHGMWEHVSGETCLVIDSWEFFHKFPLLGYSMESFYSALGVDDFYAFSDSVFLCECGKLDDNDTGYTYNYRIVNDCTQLGINCGCFEEYCLNEYQDYSNDPDRAMELEVAEKLQDQGKLEHIERFIGGMVDGRGGSYGGERTREGDPKEVLKELLDQDPDGEYLFSHDESGQFQTYFSVWKIIEE